MAGQIGREPIPEQYIVRLVEIFREVRRVLRADGTLWLNIADSYAGSGKGRNADGSHRPDGKQGTNRGTIAGVLHKAPSSVGCKPKDLMGIPWMLAFALQARWVVLAFGHYLDEKQSHAGKRKRPSHPMHEHVFCFQNPAAIFTMQKVWRSLRQHPQSEISGTYGRSIKSPIRAHTLLLSLPNWQKPALWPDALLPASCLTPFSAAEPLVLLLKKWRGTISA